jgi:hypothetical protein
MIFTPNSDRPAAYVNRCARAGFQHLHSTLSESVKTIRAVRPATSVEFSGGDEGDAKHGEGDVGIMEDCEVLRRQRSLLCNILFKFFCQKQGCIYAF